MVGQWESETVGQGGRFRGEGGRGFAPKVVMKRFLRLMRPMGARVLKFDSGLWPLRVVVSTPLASMSIKTALRANLPALQSF